MTQSYSNQGIHFREICNICQGVYREIKQTERVEQPPVLIRGWLIPYIEGKLSKESPYQIEVKLRDFGPEPMPLYGYILRKANRAEVAVARGIDTNFRNLVTAKELSHLLIDCPEHYTSDPVALAQSLIVDIPDAIARGDLMSEHITLCAAIELLLPWCFRGYLEGMAKEGHSHEFISQHFRVPPKLVTAMLSSDYGIKSRETNLSVEKGY